MVNLRMEAARFALYLSIPVVATCVYAQPDCINWIVNRWKYITYPPQAISREEFLQKVREVAAQDDAAPPKKD